MENAVLHAEWTQRAVVMVCACFALGLTIVAVRHGGAIYRSRFVRIVSAGLKHNFVVADAQTMFVLSVVLTVLLSALGYATGGPVIAIGLGLLAALAPRLTLRYIKTKRTKQFIYQLPDALLALASALRAGSNLSKGLELLATRQSPPLSQEFSIVLAEYRVGRQLQDSLLDMRKRIDTPELDLLNTALNVARRVGGNLADTLESLARTLQDKAHMEGKIDALTSMGRAQGWVVGLLPVFIGAVLYKQQPARMSLLFTEVYGWAVLVVVALMMGAAAWMIRKIVNIDI